MVSQYNWSPVGQKSLYRGYKYGTRLNCFGTLNAKNGTITLTQEDKGNSDAMVNHLTVVRSHYPKEKKLLIFTDNASWHKTTTVKDYCKDNNIELWFTPPYAPEFNPIERVWSFMKSIVKKKLFTTAKDFKKFVLELFASLEKNYALQLKNLCCSLI